MAFFPTNNTFYLMLPGADIQLGSPIGVNKFLRYDKKSQNTLIDINTIELKQLIKHPYIEYYQARDIIKLRGRGMVFRNADDLRAVPSMSDSTLERLLPYISFDGSPKQAESSPTAQ